MKIFLFSFLILISGHIYSEANAWSGIRPPHFSDDSLGTSHNKLNLDSMIAEVLFNKMRDVCYNVPPFDKDLSGNLILSEMYCSGFSLCGALNQTAKEIRGLIGSAEYSNVKLDRTTEIKLSDCEGLSTYSDCVELIAHTVNSIVDDDDDEGSWARVINDVSDYVSLRNELNGTSGMKYTNFSSSDTSSTTRYIIFDGAVKFTFQVPFLSNKRISSNANPFFEAHKNTLSSQKTDNFKYGVELNSHWMLPILPDLHPKLFFSTAGSFFKNDAEQKTEGQVNLYVTPGIQANKNGLQYLLLRYEPIGHRKGTLNIPKESFEVYAGIIQPTLGIEYSFYRQQVKDPIDPSVLAYLLRLNPQFYFYQRLFSFQADFQWRAVLNKTKYLGSRNTFFRVLTASFNLIGNNLMNRLLGLKKGIAATISWSYQEGANPWQGITDQIVRKVTVEVMF